jgi:AcrR family transcriptional regulator
MSMGAETAAPRRRQGRRPGSNDNRQLVLDAARARFATDGYAGSTIRKIATDAGVDASLVMQFFGSKQELFAAVLSITPASLTRFSDAFDGPHDTVGERVTRAFLAVWDGDPQDSEPLLAMLRAAISNEQATTQVSDFIQSRITDALAPQLRDDEDATIHAGLVASMLVGVIVGRRMVRVGTMVDADHETLVGLIAPAIQTILDARRGDSKNS